MKPNNDPPTLDPPEYNWWECLVSECKKLVPNNRSKIRHHLQGHKKKIMEIAAELDMQV